VIRRAAIAPLLAAATACSDITPPRRAEAYPFDLAGDVFHWTPDRLPVRHYADPRGAMRALVVEALRVWEAQFLYGEFRGVLVSDSLAADVIVVWADSVPPDVAADTMGAVGACGGVTSFTVDSTDTIESAIRVQIGVNDGFTPAQVAACLPRVTRHELGHALGILTHSADSADLMHGTPAVGEPSAADRATVEVLYHTPPTIAPPPR
jgi:predicted Zn-dependent protease